MPAEGMSVGDAILTLKADTTQLDQGLDSVGPKVQAKLAPAETAVKNLGDSFVSAGQKASGSMQDARATIALLGEDLGVVIPRHLQTLAASSEIAGAALKAALPLAAGLAVIDVLEKVADKINEFINEPRILDEAWSKVTDTSVIAGRAMTKAMDDAQAKIIGLTQGPLAEADYKIQHLGTDAQEVGQYMGKLGDEITKALNQEQYSKFNPLSWFTDNSQVQDQAKQFFADLQHSLIQLGNPAGLVLLKSQVQTVEAEIAGLSATLKDASIGEQAVEQKKIDMLREYEKQLLDAQKIVQQGIDLDAKTKTAETLDRNRIAGQLAAEQAKRNLDGEIAKIGEWKANVHAAYDSGKTDAATWQVAQLQAVNAVQTAQENYLTKLIAIYTKSGDVVSLNAAQQQLANTKIKEGAKDLEDLSAAIQKHNQYGAEMRKTWVDILSVNVDKEWQKATASAHGLAEAEENLAKAQEQLAEVNIAGPYAVQEEKIKQLAKDRVITERDMANQLIALYRKEEAEAKKPFDDLLATQKHYVAEAQAALDQARGNPFFTDAQLNDLKKNLDDAQAKVAATQAQIVKLQTGTEQKIQKSTTDIGKDFQKLGPILKSFEQTLQDTGSKSQAIGQVMGEAISEVSAAYAQGSVSIGQAIREIVKAELEGIASLADKKGTEALAKAFGEWDDPHAAASDFASATLWFSLGGAVSAAAAFSGGGSSSGAGSGSSANGGSPISTSPAGQTQQQPTQLVNVQHFADGGLISRNTLAMIGENNQPEAVLPLGSNHAAMDIIADKIVARMGPGGGGTVVHNHNYPKGLMMGTAKEVTRHISKAVEKGTARLHSSSTGRVIRKSS